MFRAEGWKGQALKLGPARLQGLALHPLLARLGVGSPALTPALAPLHCGARSTSDTASSLHRSHSSSPIGAVARSSAPHPSALTLPCTSRVTSLPSSLRALSSFASHASGQLQSHR